VILTTTAKGRCSWLQHTLIAVAVLLLLGSVTTQLNASMQEPGMALRRQSIPAPWTNSIQANGTQAEQELASFDIEFEMRPGDSGVLLVGGDDSETFTLWVRNGRAVWMYQGVFQSETASIESGYLPAGLVKVRFEFAPEQSVEAGRHRIGSLFVNGDFVGRILPSNCPVPDNSQQSSKIGARESAQIEKLAPEHSFTGIIVSVTTNRDATR